MRSEVIEKFKTLVWSPKEQRRELHAAGINVLPQNFYSSIPSIEEIQNSFEYTEENPPYLNKQIFNKEALQHANDLLAELTKYSVEFSPPDDEEKGNHEGFYWNNSQFTLSDAMSYYSFIRKVKPKKIIEIGSGFSTLVAINALKKNGSGELICIEPYPRDFLLDNDYVQLKKLKAQDLSIEELNAILSDGDILFIDSTHTVKSGSDCLHIYLRLLPEINSSIYVHVHDIFFPFSLPKEWLLDHHIYWSEQYLLMALLMDTKRYEFLYGSHFHLWANPQELSLLMHGRTKTSEGGSLWFRIKT